MPRHRKAVSILTQGSGPVPVFVRFSVLRVQASQHRRQHFGDRAGASSTMNALLQDLGYDLRFVVARIMRQLSHSRLEVGEHLVARRLMFLMKTPQFFQNRLGLLEARMPHGLIAGDARERQPTKERLKNNFPKMCGAVW